MLDCIRSTARLRFALGLVLFAAPLGASAVTIPVLDDASVYEFNPSQNYATSTHEGGLFTGTADDSEARFYLKFVLPAFVPGTQVVSATLTGTYNEDLIDAVDAVHGIFLAASDAWSELTLTWANQPGILGGPVATWDAAAEAVHPVLRGFDVTSAVDSEYQGGDGAISLVFAVLDPGPNLTWEYWSSKEHTSQPGFSLDVTIAPVPEPATGLLAALGLVLLGGLARRR